MSLLTVLHPRLGPYDVSRMNTVPAIVERAKPRRKIRLPEVLRRTGLSRSTVYELMEQDLFPAEAKSLGTRTALWWADEIDEWNECPDKEAWRARRAGTPPAQRPKEASTGSETTIEPRAVTETRKNEKPAKGNGAAGRKPAPGKKPSGEMSGLERTGMTILGRDVYRHVASNRLLLDVGVLLQ